MSIQSMQRQDKDEKVSQEIEKIMEDIDTGKVKTTRFTADEFLKFVDKTFWISLWQLDFDTFHIEKKIKKFKSDKTIIDNFKKIVVELANSDDPRRHERS